MQIAQRICELYDPALVFTAQLQDGDHVSYGQIAFTLEGSARSILAIERLLLNCMQHMSGIATQTADGCHGAAVIGDSGAERLGRRGEVLLLLPLGDDAARAREADVLVRVGPAVEQDANIVEPVRALRVLAVVARDPSLLDLLDVLELLEAALLQLATDSCA